MRTLRSTGSQPSYESDRTRGGRTRQVRLLDRLRTVVSPRARLRASIGEPLKIPLGRDYAKVTAILEQAVRTA